MTTEPESTENTELLEERNDEPLEEVEETTEPSDATEDTEDSEDSEDTEQGKGNRREARYRRRLRDTEAERDTLRGQVETMQRGEVERLAGARLSRPGAIWAAGTDLAGLLDDQGRVDVEKVSAAAEAAAVDLGLAQPSRRPRPDRAQGGEHTGPAASAWTDAFKNQR